MRELLWMSRGKNEAEWARTTAEMCNVRIAIGAIFAEKGAKITSVEQLIPRQFRPVKQEKAKTEEQKKIESDAGWAALGKGLGFKM